MTITSKTVDFNQFFCKSNVSNEAIDNVVEFLMEPFKSIFNQRTEIATGITFEWDTLDIVNILPEMVRYETLTQSEADEISAYINESDVTTLTYFIDRHPRW